MSPRTAAFRSPGISATVEAAAGTNGGEGVVARVEKVRKEGGTEPKRGRAVAQSGKERRSKEDGEKHLTLPGWLPHSRCCASRPYRATCVNKRNVRVLVPSSVCSSRARDPFSLQPSASLTLLPRLSSFVSRVARPLGAHARKRRTGERTSAWRRAAGAHVHELRVAGG